jgi:hypothetical protein
MEIKRFINFIKESTENKLAPNPSNLSVIKDDGRECMLLKDTSTGKKWFFYYDHIDKQDFSEFGEVDKTYIGRDEDGDPEYEYDYENYEPTEDDKLEYVKAKIKDFSIGKGIEGHDNGDDLVEIDQMLAHVLLDTFPKFTPKDLDLL